MRFSYRGREYRIIFRHDPPHELGAHVGHKLSVIELHGRQRVVCLEPGCMRDGVPVHLYPVSAKKDARNTNCYLQVKDENLGWLTFTEGRSRLNVKEGDTFSKRGGRESALKAVLGCDFDGAEDGSFADYAWNAYDRQSPVSGLPEPVQYLQAPEGCTVSLKGNLQLGPPWPQKLFGGGR